MRRNNMNTKPRSRSSSSSSSSSGATYSRERWYESRLAKRDLLSSSSAFYALVLTIFSLIFELSHLMHSESHEEVRLRDLFFGIYMYGGGLLFLFWCYFELYQEHKHKSVAETVQTMFRLEDLKEQPTTVTHVEETSKLPIPSELEEILTTGSLFLRVGCLFFGIMGIIYYGFSTYFCFTEEECNDLTTILPVLAIFFIIFQTHFIFCNWKITETHSTIVARFGTMHLVAANLWTWFRFVLFEEAEMSHHVSKHLVSESKNASNEHAGHGSTNVHECEGLACILGSVQGVMYTSIVEYSLIGAAVMYIVWFNIKHEGERPLHRGPKEYIRINFRNVCKGAFLGSIFLVLSIASMVVYHWCMTEGHKNWATLTFTVTDLAQFVVASLTCLYALYVMRVLSYEDVPEAEKDEEEESQELLDMILLTIGMTGEMIYSGAGLFGVANYLGATGNWNYLVTLILISLVCRVLQVALQSILIFVSRKLRVEEPAEIEKHPGKQAITFLLIINIAMFIMNLFEAEKFGVSDVVIKFYGHTSWVFLVRSFSPLTIFYRFHSSVLLADIWRNTYAEKIEPDQIHQSSKKHKKHKVHSEKLENGKKFEENGSNRRRNVINIDIRD